LSKALWIALLILSSCEPSGRRNPSSEDQEPWSLISNEDGISSFRGHAEDGLVVFRGDVDIDAGISTVASLLYQVSLREEWVSGLKENRMIEERSLTDRIEYNRIAVPWPFQDRDFVYQVKVRVSKNPSCIVIEMKSIDDPREPKHSGVVRGNMIHSRYELIETGNEAKRTHVRAEVAVDPQGVIPTWIVNLTQREWPRKTLGKMREVALRPGIPITKEVQDYFNGPGTSSPQDH
jgi:hypothetical protein